MTEGTPDLAAVLDDLTDGLEAVGDQIGLAGRRGRPVRAQLGEELVGVAALVEHPARVELGVAVRPGLAVEDAALRRLGRDEQPAAGVQRAGAR